MYTQFCGFLLSFVYELPSIGTISTKKYKSIKYKLNVICYNDKSVIGGGGILFWFTFMEKHDLRMRNNNIKNTLLKLGQYY